MRNLPPAACIFCDQRRKLSVEHLPPKWMGERFLLYPPEMTQVLQQRGNRITGDLQEFSGSSTAVSARVVCKMCNETWMSAIQNSAIDLIMRMAQGGSSELDSQAQAALGTWGALSAIIGRYTHSPPRPAIRDQLQWMYEQHKPPPSMSVRLAQRRPPGPNWRYNADLMGFADPVEDPEMNDWEGQVATFSILQLTIQVLDMGSLGQPTLIHVSDDWAPWQVQVWPPSTVIRLWPPPRSMDHPTLERLERQFADVEFRFERGQ